MFPRFGIWAVYRKEYDKFIGWVCLKYLDRFDEIEVGYRLLHDFWCKGYATEESPGILDYGFNKLNLERVVGVTIQENKASQNVLTRWECSLKGLLILLTKS